MFEKQDFSIEIGGKTITAEFNNMVDNADASTIISCGDTCVLITVVMEKEAKESPYFPLVVDYEERFYAAGKILGSRYVRREGRPGETATLAARMTDRTIRPLFDGRIRNSTQIVVTVLSIGEEDPDVLSILGTSLALAVSDIPWGGPIGVARILKTKDNQTIINPTYTQRENVLLETLACGKDGVINMIEMSGDEATEDSAMQSLEEANVEIEKLTQWQKEIVSKIGKEKRTIDLPEIPEETKQLFEENFRDRFDEYIFSGPGKNKHQELMNEWLAFFKETYPEGDKECAYEYFEGEVDKRIHDAAIDEGKRVDGRALDELREISAKAGGISPVAHGSGLFYRGGTKILSVLTLAGPGESQVTNEMEEDSERHFMHHYNFPPFSTGETGRLGGTNRRELGHGKLAEKALEPVLPSRDLFPYTIRVVSEALSSNGSTSQGSICASSIALMDGGVPIKRPVAGIAIGLGYRNEKEYAVLTDIQGPEDHHGGMDFKVAGTRKGITAVQMDVKLSGIPFHILREAFDRGVAARTQILDVIEKEIPTPRETLHKNAPHIQMIQIKPDQIGLVIGSGGKTIKETKDKAGVEIDIEDDGRVFITGSQQGVEQARKIIEAQTKEYVKGERIQGEVIKVVEFGAFVKLDESNDALLHVSEIAPFRIEKVEDYLKVGDTIPVVVKQIDDQGRIKLSLKDVDPNFIKPKK